MTTSPPRLFPHGSSTNSDSEASPESHTPDSADSPGSDIFYFQRKRIWTACVAISAFALLAACAHAADAPLDATASTLKFTGHAFLHDFHGEAKEFHGAAQIDPGQPELVRGATLDIAAAKMTTFVDARDRNMLAWLRTDKNPDIRFELVKVKPLQGDLAHATKDHPAAFAITGTFTLNQVAKPLETKANAWREGRRLIVDGTAMIDTADHGLPIVKQLFMTVDKNVDIAFHLVFVVPQP